MFVDYVVSSPCRIQIPRTLYYIHPPHQIAAACRQSLGNKASFGVISNKLKLLPAPTMEMANIVADSFGHISQCDMCFTQLQKLNNYQDSIATADMLMTARCGSHLVKRLTCVKKTLMECCLW